MPRDTVKMLKLAASTNDKLVNRVRTTGVNRRNDGDDREVLKGRRG
jgi:hypothetical protein